MAQRRLRAIAAAMLGGLAAACAEPTPPAPAPAPQVVAPTPTPPLPPRASAPAPRATAQAAPEPDACGAWRLQYLVGRPHTDIPAPVEPDRRRVLCSTCVTTPENEPWRQTIVFSSATGLVTSVTCR
jgi:hypothetical protein